MQEHVLVSGADFKRTFNIYFEERTGIAEVELQQVVVEKAEEVMTGLVCMQAVYPLCSQPMRRIMSPEVIRSCVSLCDVIHFE